jgi:hypothetical protein
MTELIDGLPLPPLPADVPQAIGELYGIVVDLHASNAALRAEVASLKNQLAWADYQRRIATGSGHKHKLTDVDADLGGLHLQRIVGKLVALEFTRTSDPDDIGTLSDRLIMRVVHDIDGPTQE